MAGYEEGMAVTRSTVIVQVTADRDDDGEDVIAMARRLRAELLGLDVDAVEPVTEAAAPPGAKGLSTLVGALAVRLGGAGLKALLVKIKDWAARNGRSVEVTIDGDTLKVTGVSQEQQARLIDVWLARHGGA
jgi:hypothetical protein